jgi:hypothetical protein
MIHKFTRRAIIADRPANIPPAALVFNAPRPLACTVTRDGPFEWRGDFTAGVFYVAVLPDDPDRDRQVKFNREMDAVLISYTTEQEAKGLVREYVAGYLAKRAGAELPDGMTLDEFVDEHWQHYFYDKFARQAVTVDGETFEVADAPSGRRG